MDEKKTTNNLKTVRTYMSDMADTVRANEVSVIKVALAEQNKKERERLYEKIEGTTSMKIFWLVGGVILIILALYGSYYFMSKIKIEKKNVIVEKNESIVSYDEIYSINIFGNINLVEEINNIGEKINLKENRDPVTIISLTKENAGVSEKISLSEFFSLLNFDAPGALVRSFSDDFMIGYYSPSNNIKSSDINNDSSFFIILQSRDYENSYAGMLEWEEYLVEDFFDFYNFNTGLSYEELSKLNFVDLIIKNKDSRVLYSETENPLLYYMFVDKNNIIISNTENSIKELLTRLLIKNIKPL